VKHVGAIVGSLLRLDLPGLINAVLHLLIDAGILIVDALRTVLLGFFIGHIVENFDRNSLRRFVGRLLGNTFAEPRPHASPQRALHERPPLGSSAARDA
jgi:fluoride ion exporter CrcB/FEX